MLSITVTSGMISQRSVMSVPRNRESVIGGDSREVRNENANDRELITGKRRQELSCCKACLAAFCIKEAVQSATVVG